jgi:hypothetical protein
MNASQYNFVTVNEILSDVLKLVDDERYETNSKGYYTSLVQQALEGLAFDTFFDVRREDFVFPIETLGLQMPAGAFNVKEVYIYHGTECDISRSQKVWWKRNYYTTGNGYFANNKGDNGNDPIMPHNSLGRMAHGNARANQHRTSVESHYFYNVQNGLIMFSSFCRSFPRVHVVYNGVGCDIGDAPVIPLFLREAVVDFMAEFTLRIKMAKPDGRQWTQLWQVYDKRLNRDLQYGWAQGSWYRADQRVKTMSSGEREDLFEYLNRGAWQSGL